MNKKDLIADEIKTAALVLRALNNKLRRDILYLLDKHKKMNVTELYVALRIEQSVCSNQLRILQENGIVKNERVLKSRYYSIVPERLEYINTMAKAIVNGTVNVDASV